MKMSTDKMTNQDTPNVSEAVIRRLPRYYRYLGELCGKGVLRVSSAELSRLMRVTSSQIRQDFNCFGGFGQQGYGYNVRYLYNKISELLGVNACFTGVVIGAGNLGRALLSSPMFQKRGVVIAGVFDNDPNVIGTVVSDHPVMDVKDCASFFDSIHVDFAILTVPRAVANETAEEMARLGIPGIWNFSNAEIDADALGVIVENVHMSDSLMRLMYRLNGKKEEQKKE